MSTRLAPLPDTRTERHDLYGTIHKALRACMADTLTRLGAADADDGAERNDALARTEALLTLLNAHVEHEDAFVHSAIEARRPGAAAVTAAAHDEHLLSIEALRGEVQAVRSARPAQRAASLRRLYGHLALFVAENLQHMAVEESVNNQALWALYDDTELEALHDRLLAHVSPAVMGASLQWMARGLSPQELLDVFADLRHKAPPEAFAAAFDHAHAVMDTARWARLARGLGLPPVPGLMTV